MRILLGLFFATTVLFSTGLSAKAQPELFAIATEAVQRIGEEPAAEAALFPDSVLYSIDPNTAAPQAIGTIVGYTKCTGLDIHPVTGEFFAVCEINIENGKEAEPVSNAELEDTYLLKLNPDTAQATEVGPIPLSRADFVSDISFRHSDGTLFAHINSDIIAMAEEEVTTNTAGANTVAIIDTQTAALNILGPTGSDDNWSAIGFTTAEMLIQCTDNRFMPGVVNRVNQLTGGATFLDNLTYPIGLGEGINIVASKDVDTLTGVFYGLLAHLPEDDDPEASANGLVAGNFLVNIDQSTGQIFEIGFIANAENQFAALAVRSMAFTRDVPTLSEYGLIVTVVLLFGAAVVFLRRRQMKSGI